MSIALFLLGVLAVLAGAFLIHPGLALVLGGAGLLRVSAVLSSNAGSAT